MYQLILFKPVTRQSYGIWIGLRSLLSHHRGLDRWSDDAIMPYDGDAILQHLTRWCDNTIAMMR